MQIFYKIMQKMIFCEQHEIITDFIRVRKGYDKTRKIEKCNYFPPYFQCIEVFKNE